jgi:hypothetical protein
MICHCSSLLQRSTVLQIRRDASGPERVIANARLDASGCCPSPDHRVCIRLGKGRSGKQPGVATNGAEKNGC